MHLGLKEPGGVGPSAGESSSSSLRQGGSSATACMNRGMFNERSSD